MESKALCGGTEALGTEGQDVEEIEMQQYPTSSAGRGPASVGRSGWRRTSPHPERRQSDASDEGGQVLVHERSDEVLILPHYQGTHEASCGAGWRRWGEARRSELGLWAFFVLVGALIILAGTFLVLHNASRVSKHPNLSHPDKLTFLYRTQNGLALPAGAPTEFVWNNVSRPEPGQAVAIHQIRIQVVDETGEAVPLEQVYRFHLALLASADAGDEGQGDADADARDSASTSRVLAALGPEGSKKSVNLPQGYYLLSAPNERWSLRCKLLNSWSQLSSINVTVFLALNITYSPLTSATAQEMIEVHYHALGSMDVISSSGSSSKPNSFVLPADGQGDVARWSYDVVGPSQPSQVILAFGFTQLGALSSELLEVAHATRGRDEEKRLLALTVTYERSGFIASMDRQYPLDLVLPANTSLRIRNAFANRPFGPVIFYWQLYLRPCT